VTLAGGPRHETGTTTQWETARVVGERWAELPSPRRCCLVWGQPGCRAGGSGRTGEVSRSEGVARRAGAVGLVSRSEDKPSQENEAGSGGGGSSLLEVRERERDGVSTRDGRVRLSRKRTEANRDQLRGSACSSGGS
jgi:hypothetical protein